MWWLVFIGFGLSGPPITASGGGFITPAACVTEASEWMYRWEKLTKRNGKPAKYVVTCYPQDPAPGVTPITFTNIYE